MPLPKRDLPDFDAPPVVETLLGVQFSSTKQFPTRLYTEYWKRIMSRFPSLELQGPLPAVTEEFGRPQALAFGIQLVQGDESRYWYIDESETRLLQIQKDRFIHNWRRIKDEPYPHYDDDIRPRFEKEWVEFCSFLSDRGYDRPAVNQCEVTYVNHIEIESGEDSNHVGDLSKVISCWSDTYSGHFLKQPETTTFNIRYVMPENRGRLHIIGQPVIRKRDAKQVFQLNLTARGKPKSSELPDIVEWLNLGREWIVRGFTDFTTPQMHKVWKRKEGL